MYYRIKLKLSLTISLLRCEMIRVLCETNDVSHEEQIARPLEESNYLCNNESEHFVVRKKVGENLQTRYITVVDIVCPEKCFIVSSAKVCTLFMENSYGRRRKNCWEE